MRRTILLLLAVVPLGISGCQTDQTLSVKEALTLTADVQKQSFEPPPRTISDIAAVLDESQAGNTALTAKLRNRADATPPGAGTVGDLASFYFRRSKAAFAVGRHVQALEDSRKAADYLAKVRKSGASHTSSGARIRAAGFLSQQARMEAIFGNYRQAKTLVESGLEEAYRIRQKRGGEILKLTNDAIAIYRRTGDLEAIELAALRARGVLQKFANAKRGAQRKSLHADIFRMSWEAEVLQQRGQ